jgi:hypothetical protein
MARKYFIKILTENIRIRFMIDTEKGVVKDFLVQLEIYQDTWSACIRYNYAHGKPHKDILYSDGRKKKVWIDVDNLSALIDAAQRDLSENFYQYIRETGYET